MDVDIVVSMAYIKLRKSWWDLPVHKLFQGVNKMEPFYINALMRECNARAEAFNYGFSMDAEDMTRSEKAYDSLVKSQIYLRLSYKLYVVVKKGELR